MKLTIQKLANLLNHSWELQREVGFHMQATERFRQFFLRMSDKDMREVMENLGLLFEAVKEIGGAEIELKAEGEHSLWAPLCRVQTAKRLDCDENIENDEATRKSA